MSQLAVGVDAGGTRTVAALAREGAVLRTIEGECGNASVVGIERACATVVRTIELLLEGKSAAAIVAGAAGAGNESVRGALQSALRERFGQARISVTDDAPIALRASLPEGDGAVLVAGTGSIAYAEIGGVIHRAGGYGYLFGDPGSGFAIGSAGLRLLLECEGEIDSDPLLRDLAVHVGSHERAQLLARVYGSSAPAAYVAACAPVVLRYANSDEPRADAIVRGAAAALFELARTIVASARETSMPLVLAGGLLRQRNALRDLLEARIGMELPRVRLIPGDEPYLGAVAQALRMLSA